MYTSCQIVGDYTKYVHNMLYNHNLQLWFLLLGTDNLKWGIHDVSRQYLPFLHCGKDSRLGSWGCLIGTDRALESFSDLPLGPKANVVTADLGTNLRKTVTRNEAVVPPPTSGQHASAVQISAGSAVYSIPTWTMRHMKTCYSRPNVEIFRSKRLQPWQPRSHGDKLDLTLDCLRLPIYFY